MSDSKAAFGARVAMEPVSLAFEYRLCSGDCADSKVSGNVDCGDGSACSGDQAGLVGAGHERWAGTTFGFEEALGGASGGFEATFDLVPQNVVEVDGERAKKYVRDLGSTVASSCDGASSECRDFAGRVLASFDGEVLSISLEPACALQIRGLRIVLRHAFAGDERVLLNGYQSWTKTTELSPWAHMRGLRVRPKQLVRRFGLDGSGDYSFVSYDLRRGFLHGFSYATFRRGEGMVLVGSLDEARGFTLIRTDASAGLVTLEPECPAVTLAKNTIVELGRFAIVRGSMGACYDRWFELLGICPRAIRPLVGYTSWYRHYDDIDEEKLDRDFDRVRSVFSQLATRNSEEVLKVFQIDDGYSKVGDWLDVDAKRFPRGLAPLAQRIREAGFVPGLWIAPFACARDSSLFAQRPEWLLRDEQGNPVMTGPHWGGGYALDTRNVEVRSYILDVLQTMTRDWGFSLIKADFLYSACMRVHSGLNRGELMADAIDLLRKGVGDDTLVIGCGVPLASAFGKLDYCRIGCDVGLDWDGGVHMRLAHRERISTRNSLANTYARAPLDGRAFGNDPDVFFLRPDVRLSDAQRFKLLSADADLGHVLLTSDDMGMWTTSMRERYVHAVEALTARCKA